jgi:hypothetical protein
VPGDHRSEASIAGDPREAVSGQTPRKTGVTVKRSQGVAKRINVARGKE